ncbi:MAG: DUF3326 domain-containing protein [Pseudanabaenaceae cyanobacterium]
MDSQSRPSDLGSHLVPNLNVLLLIPTGINAAIGGYAGDGLPLVRATAAIADTVITHPNAMNGASLYWSLPNVLYVEGYGLDQMTQGKWNLRPVRQNRIGVILDAAIEPDLALRHRQVIMGTQATLGLNITAIATTDQPLGVELRSGNSGATWGTIARPDALLRAAQHLLHSQKVDAIAVVARFPDDPDSLALQQYRQGAGVDALAGAEAVISHLIVREFMVPCAHAPALQPLPLDPTVSPLAAAEELGFTFLPCVLVGLSRAPKFVMASHTSYNHHSADLTAQDISVVLSPYSACGGASILALCRNPQTHLIFVRENTTALDVTPESLGIDGIVVDNYWEGLGIITALRSGINPYACRRPWHKNNMYN